jgi:hypothetical protein
MTLLMMMMNDFVSAGSPALPVSSFQSAMSSNILTRDRFLAFCFYLKRF